MLNAAIALCALMVPAAAATLYADFKGRQNLKVIFKGLTSLLFVTAGVLCYSLKSGLPALLILAGLVFGLIGDVFLAPQPEHDKKKLLLQGLGMLAFVIGHVLYSSAFFMLADRFKLLLFILILGTPFAASMCFGSKMLNADKPVIRFGAVFYALVIGIMLAAAVNARVYNSGTAFDLLLSGAVLFSLSDALLAYLNFNEKANRKIIYPLVLIFYYTGQALIACCIAVL